MPGYVCLFVDMCTWVQVMEARDGIPLDLEYRQCWDAECECWKLAEQQVLLTVDLSLQPHLCFLFDDMGYSEFYLQCMWFLRGNMDLPLSNAEGASIYPELLALISHLRLVWPLGGLIWDREVPGLFDWAVASILLSLHPSSMAAMHSVSAILLVTCMGITIRSH